MVEHRCVHDGNILGLSDWRAYNLRSCAQAIGLSYVPCFLLTNVEERSDLLLMEGTLEACEAPTAFKGYVVVLEYSAVVHNLSDLVSMYKHQSHRSPKKVSKLRF